MKVKLLLMMVLILNTIKAHGVHWTEFSQVKSIYPRAGVGVFVKLDIPVVNSDNCGMSDWYVIHPSNDVYTELFSFILASKKTSTPIRLYVSGCSSNRPQILGAHDSHL